MDLEIFFGRDAELIRIEANGHDTREHIIVPNGPLRFLVNAYDGTEKFFRGLGWNYIVFGFDWRRELGEAASQLEAFLSSLRDAVKDLRDWDPLPTATLLAHSQGGLVAKIFLHRICGNDGQGMTRWCERLVTVATPFYGTATHHDRYYQGQSPLNTFYGTQRMAEIAATLPGPYILMYADKPTLDRDGARLGLAGYPIKDADSGEPADPYDPANLGRYPKWIHKASIEAARDIRETITAPLPEAAQKRVFHIRSGLNLETGAGLAWKAVNGQTYTPDQGSPIKMLPGPGDDTVPFWSARLADTPMTNVYDLKQAKAHGSLAEHRETLEVVQRLVANGTLPEPATIQVPDATLGVLPAPKDALNQFITGIQAGQIQKNDPRASDPAIWRGLLNEVSLC